MKIFKKFIVLYVAILTIWSVPAYAQGSEGAYSVKNYEVVYKSGNSSVYREEAIKKATKEAFPKLLRQLTPHNTWGLHDNLLQHVNWDEISYKSDFVSEKRKPYYKAIIDVYYRAKAVKDLLTRFNIPYSESTGGKVIILPVFESGGSKQLWETVNPLKPIIEKDMRKHSLFEFTIPTGEIQDTAGLTANMAILGAGDLILNLADKYEAVAAIVFHAKVSQRFGGYYLDVTATWYEKGRMVEPSLYSAPITNIAFINGEIDFASLNSAFKLSINDILSRIGSHKRNQGLVEVNKPGRVFLRFKPADARDLEKLKELVSNLNTIREFKLRVLNVTDSVFQVDFFGEKSVFKDQLKKLKLSIVETAMPMVWKVQFKNDPFLGPVDYGFESGEGAIE